MEQVKNVRNIFDLMAVCGVYIFKKYKEINENKEKPYDFLMFQENRFDNVYDAIEEYCCVKSEQGRIEAFAELQDFILEFLEQGINIEKCYAIFIFIPASNEPNAVLARAFGECREGQYPI